MSCLGRSRSDIMNVFPGNHSMSRHSMRLYQHLSSSTRGAYLPVIYSLCLSLSLSHSLTASLTHLLTHSLTHCFFNDSAKDIHPPLLPPTVPDGVTHPPYDPFSAIMTYLHVKPRQSIFLLPIPHHQKQGSWLRNAPIQPDAYTTAAASLPTQICHPFHLASWPCSLLIPTMTDTQRVRDAIHTFSLSDPAFPFSVFIPNQNTASFGRPQPSRVAPKNKPARNATSCRKPTQAAAVALTDVSHFRAADLKKTMTDCRTD